MKPSRRRDSSAAGEALPIRDGVTASSVVLPSGPWTTIAEFLIHRFPGVTAETWHARMAAGDVRDEHGGAVDAERGYEPHLRIHYYRALATEPKIPFEATVLFQDDYLVVADKPHFLPVIPSGKYLQETLLVRLRRSLGIDTLAPVHRLDRETAGVVLFTIQPATRKAYQDLFLEKAVAKRYEAIAPWRPELKFPLTYRSRLEDHGEHFMQVREVPGEPNSETRLDVIEVRGQLARYTLTPLTGRKHQLRAHCAALGLPILHDRIYPTLLPENTDDYRQPLQLLAKSICFRDPITHALRDFSSGRELAQISGSPAEPKQTRSTV